jgi:hypothetical protein
MPPPVKRRVNITKVRKVFFLKKDVTVDNFMQRIRVFNGRNNAEYGI